MNTTQRPSYVIETQDDVPLHLRDRAPFSLSSTEMILRRPADEIVGSDGMVKMAGAIEFQTQVTPGVLTDVCDPSEIYESELRQTHRFRCVYDPEIQRGVKETSKGPKEFLRDKQIESMMRDIENNVFECPQLMWNLRAGEAVWVYIKDKKELRIYEGVATRPDTNHRHHAIVRFHRRYQEWVAETESTEMGEYNRSRAYGIAIYTDDFKGEAHRFYVYNFLGWRVSTSTAHYIESKTHAPNLYSRLARELMERSGVLSHENVEILTNHLSRNSAKMVTFGTLVESLRGAFPGLSEEDYHNVLEHLVRFLAALNKIRPREIAVLGVSHRQRAKATNIVDQAVLWHAYFKLASRIFGGNFSDWKERLQVLGMEYRHGDYAGDFFSRNNPLWMKHEVIVAGKKGPRVQNNRQARQGAYEYLCEVTEIPSRDFSPNAKDSMSSSPVQEEADDQVIG